MTGNSAICNNVDEPGEHYAQWNKPDPEGKIQHVNFFRFLL